MLSAYVCGRFNIKFLEWQKLSVEDDTGSHTVCNKHEICFT